MTPEERDALAYDLASFSTTQMTPSDLRRFFFDGQYEYFNSLPEQDLIDSDKEIRG